MEMADAAGIKLPAQLPGDRRGDQLPRLPEARPALRTAGPSTSGSPRRTGRRTARVVATLVTGRMPGTISTSGPDCGHPVAEAQETFGREEELRDRPVCARIDLAQQIVEIAFRAIGIRMLLGIGGDRDFERRDLPSVRQPALRHWRSRLDAADSAVPVLADRRAARRYVGRPHPNSSARSRRFRRVSRQRRSDARPA